MKSSGSSTLLLLLCMVAPATANDWTAAGTDNLWSNADNWSQGVVPLNASSHPLFGWDDPLGDFYPLTPDLSDDGAVGNNDAQLTAEGATILIDSSVAATAYGVRIGRDGATNTLEITGGSLQVGGVPASGGDSVGWHLDVGRGFNRSNNPDPLATLVMTGGEVESHGFLIPESFVDELLEDPYDTPGVNGKVVMSGGTITSRWMNVGQFTGNGEVELSGDAVINLWPSVASNRNNSGHFEMKRNWYIDGQSVTTKADAHLDIRDDAVINIFGHRNEFTMTPDQAEIDRMQQYVEDGWLTANNGTADPIFTLQECPADGTFEDICLSGMMITITAPEQESVGGDFNSDGKFDCDDIDALILEIAAGTNGGAFDLNGDGVVTTADRDAWLVEAGAAQLASMNGYPVGDLDLSGSVDSTDLGLLLNNFSATGGIAYCGGEIDGDSNVNSTDLGLLLNNFGTTVSATSAAAVPEPNGLVLVLWALGLLTWRRDGSKRNGQ